MPDEPRLPPSRLAALAAMRRRAAAAAAPGLRPFHAAMGTQADRLDAYIDPRVAWAPGPGAVFPPAWGERVNGEEVRNRAEERAKERARAERREAWVWLAVVVVLAVVGLVAMLRGGR